MNVWSQLLNSSKKKHKRKRTMKAKGTNLQRIKNNFLKASKCFYFLKPRQNLSKIYVRIKDDESWIEERRKEKGKKITIESIPSSTSSSLCLLSDV